jgi:hypothetical protein
MNQGLFAQSNGYLRLVSVSKRVNENEDTFSHGDQDLSREGD